MKKLFAVIIAGTVFFTVWMCEYAGAGVDVNISIEVPPPLALPAPPPLMVIPGTYAYFAPDVDADIIFFEGYWYRPYRGGWYRSTVYNGRWAPVPPRRVPSVLMNLPSNWRRVPPGHERIPYGQVKKNWRQWEHEKHWDWQARHHEHREEIREHGQRGGGGHRPREEMRDRGHGGGNGHRPSQGKGKGRGRGND